MRWLIDPATKKESVTFTFLVVSFIVLIVCVLVKFFNKELDSNLAFNIYMLNLTVYTTRKISSNILIDSKRKELKTDEDEKNTTKAPT